MAFAAAWEKVDKPWMFWKRKNNIQKHEPTLLETHVQDATTDIRIHSAFAT